MSWILLFAGSIKESAVFSGCIRFVYVLQTFRESRRVTKAAWNMAWYPKSATLCSLFFQMFSRNVLILVLQTAEYNKANTTKSHINPFLLLFWRDLLPQKNNIKNSETDNLVFYVLNIFWTVQERITQKQCFRGLHFLVKCIHSYSVSIHHVPSTKYQE